MNVINNNIVIINNRIIIFLNCNKIMDADINHVSILLQMNVTVKLFKIHYVI